MTMPLATSPTYVTQSSERKLLPQHKQSGMLPNARDEQDDQMELDEIQVEVKDVGERFVRVDSLINLNSVMAAQQAGGV